MRVGAIREWQTSSGTHEHAVFDRRARPVTVDGAADERQPVGDREALDRAHRLLHVEGVPRALTVDRAR